MRTVGPKDTVTAPGHESHGPPTGQDTLRAPHVTRPTMPSDRVTSCRVTARRTRPGWLGCIGWVGLRTHNPAGYFHMQSLWGSRFDFGHHTGPRVRHLIVGHDTLVVYATATISLGSLLPAFPLLLPLAPHLARSRLRGIVDLLTALVGVSLFYGAHLLTVSHRAL